MRCGLLGEALSHSFSPAIHRRLGDYSYELMPTPREKLADLFREKNFDGLNVTIPYKQAVMAYCDAISPEAEKIGAVNTIVNRGGVLTGYNTDIDGFIYMLRRRGIDVCGRNVLILGSGGTYKTARTACESLGAARITRVSRSGETNYENVYALSDTEIIINTTPVGMFPGNLVSPIRIEAFPKLRGVADVVYNPLRTKLIMDSERLNIPCTGGLSMLVAQAEKSAELFTGEAIDDSVAESILRELSAETGSVALIGMPGCGKSTVGKILSEKLKKRFFDADSEITRTAGRSIPEIFAADGEGGFRDLECSVLRALGSKTGAVIATGGGCVTRRENYPALHQNCTIIYIRRPTSRLPTAGRPLSQRGSLDDMFRIRRPLYEGMCDGIVDSMATPEETAEKITEVLNEISYY